MTALGEQERRQISDEIGFQDPVLEEEDDSSSLRSWNHMPTLTLNKISLKDPKILTVGFVVIIVTFVILLITLSMNGDNGSFSHDNFVTVTPIFTLSSTVSSESSTTKTVITKPPLQCFTNGQCLNSPVVGGLQSKNYDECLKACRVHESSSDEHLCTWFSYLGDTNHCLLFSKCLGGPNATSCQQCFSGQVDCPEETFCNVKGHVIGHLVNSTSVKSKWECLSICNKTESCDWYTFNSLNGLCFLTKNFLSLDSSCSSCTSGTSDCPVQNAWTKIMIVGGYPSIAFNEVEVVDLEAGDHQNCLEPRNYPGADRGSAGTFIEGKPMVCGGEERDNRCFYYDKTTNLWKASFNMFHGRYCPGSIMINETSWKVNPEEAGIRINASRTLTLGWKRYVDTPNGKRGHCILRYNFTHFFFAGGEHSQRVDFFDLNKEKWIQLPDMTQIRTLPTCGLVTRTNGEIEAVMAGGRINRMVYNNAEIFSFKTKTWRAGPSMPFAMTLSHGLPYENSFIAVGGNKRTDFTYNSIYRYNELNDTWIELEPKLRLARGVYTAFYVPDHAVEC